MIIKYRVSRQLFALIMAVILMVISFAITPVTAIAAAPAHPTGTAQQRIDQLLRLFPDGSYFTVDGKACSHTRRETCNNCRMSSVMTQRLGYPNANGFMDGHTCVGFARFAFFYIWGIKDNVGSGNAPAGSQRVSVDQAKLGDMVRLSGGDHWGIFVRSEGNNVFIYDANGSGGISQVRYGVNKYSKTSVSSVVRANNYVDSATAGNDPQGSYDAAIGGNGTVRVHGWAFDNDSPSQSISVHVYIGGPAGSTNAEGHAIAANISRPDVNNIYKISGNHGFDATIATSKSGVQDVYVYAINAPGTGGNNVLLGKKTVTITANDPQGSYDAAIGGKRTVRVHGWAFDKDSPSLSISVHVYIGGPAGSANAEGYAIIANISRSDVNTIYKISGNHGFDSTITTSKSGVQDVYVYAINAPGTGGNNVLLGKKTVTIS